MTSKARAFVMELLGTGRDELPLIRSGSAVAAIHAGTDEQDLVPTALPPLNPLAGEGEETPVAAPRKLLRSPHLSLTQVPGPREPRMERRGQ
jgi:hypothetical protein